MADTKNMVFCPKCGIVHKYGYVEQVRRMIVFTEDGEPDGKTEDEAFYKGNSPRCLHCGKKVTILPKNCKNCKNSQDGEKGDNDICKFCNKCDRFDWR